ncbi:hypothetical protein F2Q68_00005815 [Brassica cretica]|uniref:Uncharacterized protein n=1 Tax=Brassica cretica TaxID=69181 RepID=A0A8S9JGQ4_BRACR|nr:hypothetical protein F2Q68_00005815 [Brassica cretica]
MAAVCGFRTWWLWPISAAWLDPRPSFAFLVIAMYCRRLHAALHGRGSASSEHDVSGLIPPLGSVRVVWPRCMAVDLAADSIRPCGMTAVCAHWLGLLRSYSADGRRLQYMPAPHQVHSISSTQLHQVHFACPNLHISNLSLTKPTIPHMHMLCT